MRGANIAGMKWRNIDVGNAAHYITGTITEWLPLLTITEIRQRVCDDIEFALDLFNGALLAFVIMPTHVHLLSMCPYTSGVNSQLRFLLVAV